LAAAASQIAAAAALENRRAANLNEMRRGLGRLDG